MIKWRVGTKVGRTIYRDDVLVGLMDTSELAKEVVDALRLVEVGRDRTLPGAQSLKETGSTSQEE